MTAKWQSVISDRQMEVFLFSLSPSLSSARRAGRSMRGAEAGREGSEGFCQALSSMEGGGVQGRGCRALWLCS